VLVGHETKDDAAVYRLDAERAIVETVDFFTPVVDDPYWFGRIAAANAFSDVWAMGARPLFALNLVGWPVGKLPMEMLGEVLRGGAEAARLAGAPVIGGTASTIPSRSTGWRSPGSSTRTASCGTSARGPATCSSSRSRSGPAS
jgi:selenide,water dikinase